MSELVIHTKFRYKPEHTEDYITICIESTSDDVIVNGEEGKTLTQVIDVIKELIDNRALKPVYKTHNAMANENIVLEVGQFGIESDTGLFKIGNGKHSWNQLNYASGGGSGTPGDELEISVSVNTSENLISSNKVIPYNGFVVEADTLKVKIGTGQDAYNDLPYVNTAIHDVETANVGSDILTDYANLLKYADIIPEDGQVVLELDTGKYKIGDGVHKYEDLPYVSSDAIKVTDIEASSNPVPVLDDKSVFDEIDPVLKLGQLSVASGPAMRYKLTDGKTKYNSLESIEDMVVTDDESGEAIDKTELKYIITGTEDGAVFEQSEDILVKQNNLYDKNILIMDLGKKFTTKIGDGVHPYSELPTLEMSNTVIDANIVYDSEEKFTAANIILKAGYIGIVDGDPIRIKVGDGVTAWNDLPYQDGM